jgi:hypothetical protein
MKHTRCIDAQQQQPEKKKWLVHLYSIDWANGFSPSAANELLWHSLFFFFFLRLSVIPSADSLSCCWSFISTPAPSSARRPTVFLFCSPQHQPRAFDSHDSTNASLMQPIKTKRVMPNSRRFARPHYWWNTTTTTTTDGAKNGTYKRTNYIRAHKNTNRKQI